MSWEAMCSRSPRGPPHPDLAIKLVEGLVAKETQRALAENLFWAPVREDVYAELSGQEGRKEYFEVIREALRTAVMRPITPSWGMVEEVLSDALQEVLRKGREQKTSAPDIDALFRPYAARLREIPREYTPCVLVAKKTAGDRSCEVEEKSFKDLAHDFKTTPALLAIVNGRGGLDPVSPKNMQILLVPEN